MSIQTFQVKFLSELDQRYDALEIAGCIQEMTGFNDEDIEVKEVKDG